MLTLILKTDVNMRRLIFFILAATPCVSVVRAQNNPSLAWGYGFGAYYATESHAVAIDSTGNTYLLGSFIGTVDMDPSEASYLLTSGTGGAGQSWDIFLLKLNPLGDFVWAKQIGGPSHDGAIAPPMSGGLAVKGRMEIDAAGNIYLVCYVGAGCDVDPGEGIQLVGLEPTAFPDYLAILKLDPEGNLIWHGVIHDHTAALNPKGTALDKEGNLYVLGSYGDSGVNINPFSSGSPFLLYPNYITDAPYSSYISKISPDGNLEWAGALPPKPYASQLLQNSTRGDWFAVAAMSNNDVVATGYFHGTQQIRLPNDTVTMEAVGRADMYLARISKMGHLVWYRHLTGVDSTAQAFTSGISIGPADDIYVTVNTRIGYELSITTTGGLMKFDADG